MTTLSRNKGRWTPLAVAAAVLGFVTWWPIGLAVIAYIMWGGSIDDLARIMHGHELSAAPSAVFV